MSINYESLRDPDFEDPTPVETAELWHSMSEYVVRELGDKPDPMAQVVIEHMRNQAELALSGLSEEEIRQLSESARTMLEFMEISTTNRITLEEGE